MIDHDDSRLMKDPKFLALHEANKVWRDTFMLNSKERIAHLPDMHRHELFSLNQLAKICRVSAATASRKLKANSGGGRFEPEALTSLMIIRRCAISGETVRQYMLEQIVETGTSLGEVARLTGVSLTNIRRILHS